MSEKKMRILVISDSHGRNDDVAGVIEQVGPIDMLIHCGDVERGDDYQNSHFLFTHLFKNLLYLAQCLSTMTDFVLFLC